VLRMNRKKIIGACLIFLSLFWGAWNIDRANQRVFIEPEKINIDKMETLNLNSAPLSFSGQPVEIFNSREYVRILGIFNENN
jgi:hypothetical protein